MTDPDVIPGTERHPDAGQPPPPQDAPEKTAAPAVPVSTAPAGRVRHLIGQHKLGTAIAALLVAAAVVGVATGSLNGAPAASTGSSSGQQDAIVYSNPVPAPAFSIPALAVATAGQQVSLSQYAGKPLIVNFFASWCEPCQRETPLLASFYKGNHGHVTMIGVDGNDPSANAIAFVRAKGVSYPVGVDAHLIIAGAYNVGAFPQTFFLDSRHRIVYRVIGGVTQAQLTEGVRLMNRG